VLGAHEADAHRAELAGLDRVRGRVRVGTLEAPLLAAACYSVAIALLWFEVRSNAASTAGPGPAGA
jgi:hypothetical protein